MQRASETYLVDFPTLGFLGADWIERHCIIPDGFHKGEPYTMADWQLWCTVNHYRVKVASPLLDSSGQPIRSTAFFNRRSQIVAPQKTGKGPWSASLTCLEAVGPSLFCGFAQGGERYRCSDNGCSCGWVYEYELGEPMGRVRPTPLIQLLATSEDQVGNIYRPLLAMVKGGVLSEQLRGGEGFIRIGDEGRIDPVTASASARLGNPITFALMDETGLYTKTNKLVRIAETMRRGLSGMSGRAIETTNAWDPSEDSTAQRTFESKSTDLFRFFNQPPANLSYKNKADRARIHRYVYEGSWWVDLDAIEAEAAELLERDPGQAERFYGNRIVHGHGAWMPESLWEGAVVLR